MWLLHLFLGVCIIAALCRAIEFAGIAAGVAWLLFKRLAYFAFWLVIVYIAVVMYCCL